MGCVKSKRIHPAPAKDLYTSTLFAGRRHHVEQTCNKWFVLSALYGLVEPDQVIAPYDVALADQGEAARAAWAANVVVEIERRLGDVSGTVFEVHAGAAYREHGLVDGLRALGASVEVPADGLNFGEQLAFYASGSTGASGSRGYRAIGELLAEQAAPITVTFGELEPALGRPLPTSARGYRTWWGNTDRSPQGRGWLDHGWRVVGVDMARERVTFGRGRPTTREDREIVAPEEAPSGPAHGSAVPSCRVDSSVAIGPFSYRWPDSTEMFDGGWTAQVTVDGRTREVRVGVNHRDVFGGARRHVVVFVDRHPVVEGAGTDDYDESRTLVSMVRVDRHDVFDHASLPPGYEGMDVVRHRDVVSGRGARRGLAVRLREDDIEGWARHALLRLAERRGVAPAGVVDPPTPVPSEPAPREAHPRPADPSAVVAALLDHGALIAERGAGGPPKFSGDPESDRFVAEDPFAFLVAVISDQGIRAERAWKVPFELRKRLGYFDPRRIALAPGEVRRAFAGPPALHRLVNTIPSWVHLAAVKVLDDYGGDAGAIWGDEPTAEELRRRLEEFVGISQKKAAMATEILERDLGVTVQDLTGSDVAYDVHLRRVFLRCGLAERDDLSHMVAAARSARPERPGSLDFPAWDIGRRWCHPKDPDCAL